MNRILKEVVGIDVAQKELVVSIGKINSDLDIEIFAYNVFKNSDNGITSLINWVSALTADGIKVRYVMEATGVYHENLAYTLDSLDLELSVVLPNKISNYFRTLETKTITDKTASQAITRFGLERKLDN